MNQIMKYFGGAIVMSICAVAVLGILFSSAFYKGNGNWLDALGLVARDAGAKQEADMVYASDTAVKSVREQEVPVVLFDGKLRVGDTYDVNELFQDPNGTSFASVSVLGLTRLKRDGTKEDMLFDSYSSTDKTLTFSKKGEYVIRVCATDTKGIQQTSSFYIGVAR